MKWLYVAVRMLTWNTDDLRASCTAHACIGPVAPADMTNLKLALVEACRDRGVSLRDGIMLMESPLPPYRGFPPVDPVPERVDLFLDRILYESVEMVESVLRG